MRTLDLPTGTVTFLFTDIEGSTRLVQSTGDDWPRLLETHNRLLGAAIEGRGGTVVKTEGDSFFAVFAAAADAVTAAADAQRALASQPWPEGASIRARMGIHTGTGTLGGDDYVGIDVHGLRITSGTDLVSHDLNQVQGLEFETLEELTGDLGAAYREGRSMDFDQAVAYALAGPTGRWS